MLLILVNRIRNGPACKFSPVQALFLLWDTWLLWAQKKSKQALVLLMINLCDAQLNTSPNESDWCLQWMSWKPRFLPSSLGSILKRTIIFQSIKSANTSALMSVSITRLSSKPFMTTVDARSARYNTALSLNLDFLVPLKKTNLSSLPVPVPSPHA